ncbi:protein disulfide isomerase [Colletotrichum kahawae]|uniref:Protein disulfide isomerase n=1 Tax=Colletotrichum kahawae TaxID=34407 RepID=A0AAD9Y9H7_COLKA|nr:protein disulfide isomerase [Colletotrichum kahawae]
MFLNTVGLVLGAAQLVNCWEFATADEFRSALTRNEDTLVAYSYCSAASDSLETQWAEVHQEQPNAIVVNCLHDRDLCDETDLASFPATRLYLGNGNMRRYRGPRRTKDITSFAKRLSRPVITDVTQNDASDFSKSDDIVLVARLAENDESLRVRFSNLAKHYHDRYSFGVAQSSETSSSVSCHNNLDSLQFNANDLSAVDALQSLIHQCSTPLVAQLTRRNEMEYLSAGKSLVYFFTSDHKRRDEYSSDLRQLARNFQEYLMFVTVDSKEYPDMLVGLGLPRDVSEALALQNPQTGQVFPYIGKADAKSVETFIVDISEGNVQPWDGQSPMAQQDEVQSSHDEL